MGSPRAPFLLNQTLDPHTSQDTQQSVDQDSEPKELDEEIKPIPLHITMETQSRDQKAFSRQKLPLLAKNFNPIPFSPSKTLDFSLHEDLFRALNLWDFVNLDLSSDIRSDLLILLLANYDPSKNRSFVHNVEVSVSRLDLAKALNLPLEKEDGETHQDAFSKDEQKGAILHFLSSYVLLEDEDEMSILAEEAVEAAKMVKEGKANEVDWVGLIWVLVEREILDAPRLGICRYASHLTCLMKRQQPILFEMEVGLGLDAVISVHEPTDDDDNDEEEDGGYLEEFGGPGLSLGADKNGGLMDAAEDSTNWVDQGKDEDGGFEHCLRRCSSKETRGMEFEDLCKGDEFSNLGRLTSTDLLHDMEEDRVPYSPTMNSPDQNNEVFLSAGLAGNKNASSSLFFENKGKRHIDNVDIDEDETDHFHQGTPLKRMRCGGLWQEQAPSGFDSYMEQIQCTMGKAKSIYAEKEQTYLDTHLQLQYLNDTIKQKDQVIRTLEKMQVEEKRTWQHNVHSYEQELNILANLVVGYKKALKETRNKFDEYRKKCPEGDEPLYIDVSGSGGLVLTSTELKRLQLEKEEAMCQIAEEMVDAFEHDWLVKLEEYADLVVMLHGRVVEIYRQVELIKERFAKRKEITSNRSVSVNINSFPMLNGTNFKKWKEDVFIVLGCMDLDYALQVDSPVALTAESTSDQKKDFEKWERSNHISLMIMRRAIPETFRDIESECQNAKEFIAVLESRFAKNEKAETSTLINKLVSIRYKGSGSIREYILEMEQIASKLKVLKLVIPEDLLLHLTFISLPSQFGQVQVSYNTQKEKWTLNELISHLVNDEERIKLGKAKSAHFASSSKGNLKKQKKNKAAGNSTHKKHKGDDNDKVQKSSCFFCKEPSHIKKDCTKYLTWRAKKGLPELPKAK